MIVTGALLFLLGTTVSAGPLIPSLPTEIVVSKHRHDTPVKIEDLSTSRHSAFIENYIQQGTNVFFKPQFMLSSEQLPPQLQPIIAAIEKDDCKTTYPLVAPMLLEQIREPLRVVEQEIIHAPIPQVENIIEIKPAEEPVYVERPVISPTFIPQLPKLPERVVVEIEEPRELLAVIPPGPVLPPMEMPKLPILVEEVPWEQPIPIAPVVVEVEEPRQPEVLVAIPPGPVLPPMEMPKLPVMVKEVPWEQPIPIAPVVVEVEEPRQPEVLVAIPPGAVLPPMEMPKLPVMVEEVPWEQPIPIAPVVVEVEEPRQPEVLVAIPPGPVLPPMEMPKLPVMVEEVPWEQPIPIAPVVVEFEEPRQPELLEAIPPGPVLPPMEMPKLPVMVEEVPCEQPIPIAPVIVDVEKPRQPEVLVAIPPGPVLPPMEMPKLPVLAEEAPLAPTLPCDHPIPVVIKKPEVVETTNEIPHPVYFNKHPVMIPVSYSNLPQQAVQVLPMSNVASVPTWMLASIPHIGHNKDCAENVVLERVVPKMEHGFLPIALNYQSRI